LFHCPHCDFYYRSPYLSEETCLALYENLPATVWHTAEPRPYWRLALEMIEAGRVNEIVLDCGCFTGDFLRWLPLSWRKLGIEPSQRAAREADKAGVRIVGATVDTVGHLEELERPGTITLFDVLEHITEPLIFLAKLQKLLSPGGSILIMTGATDTLAWRLFGRHYWYCSLPEHVSFFSLRWFHWAAEKLGLRVANHRFLSSEPKARVLSAKQFLRIAAYTTVQKFREAHCPESMLRSIPLVRKVARWRGVPWWKQAQDHAMILLQSQ
jgi:SAM-dependent methyltransferase